MTIIGSEYYRKTISFFGLMSVPWRRCIMRNTRYAVLIFITSNNTMLFNYFNYGGRRDAKNMAAAAAAALVYQKHNNNNIMCARGMSCVYTLIHGGGAAASSSFAAAMVGTG